MTTSKRIKQAIDGWLVVDKPAGMTSIQALAAVRRCLNPQKIGHGGTLDPLATGILPIAMGEATKTIPFIMDGVKEYAFTITWGESRDTDDAEGRVLAVADRRPSAATIKSILPQFQGAIQQTPPVYSAIKINGKRAYALARAKKAPVMKPRQVVVHRLEMLAHNNETSQFTATTGKGVYIRALGRDIGLACGSVAYVSALRRLRVGGFDLSRALSIKGLDKMDADVLCKHHLLPLESVLADMPQLALLASEAKKLQQGQAIAMDSWQGNRPTQDGLMMVGMHNGHAVALVRVAANQARPVRVFQHQG